MDAAADAGAVEEVAEEGVVVAVELEELDVLDEQAPARRDRATAPVTPASRRSRVRRGVRFMAMSLRSRGVPEVSSSLPSGEPIVTTWE